MNNEEINNQDCWLDRNLSPLVLLLNGVIFLVLTILAESLYDKLLVFTAVLCLNIFRRRKIHYRITILFIFSLILVNLFPPFGRVLFTVWGVPITRDSLLTGLGKGITFTSFVLIAKYAISRDLVFPGTPGRVLARTLFFINLMQEREMRWKKTGLINRIDRLVLDLWEKGEMPAVRRHIKNSPAGLLFFILHIFVIIILLYFI